MSSPQSHTIRVDREVKERIDSLRTHPKISNSDVIRDFLELRELEAMSAWTTEQVARKWDLKMRLGEL